MRYRAPKALPGSSLIKYNINVDIYKDDAWDSLHDPDCRPGPRYMHLPADLPEDIQKQLCSEEQVLVDAMAIWKVKDGHSQNHCWDCNIYADVAAGFACVLSLKDIDAVKACREKCEAERRRAEKRRDRQGGFQEGTPSLV